jgi:hypothetical protein
VLATAAWALALAFLVALTTAWNVARPTRDVPLLSPFPQDPSITYDQALDRMRASRGRALPALLPAVDRAVHLDPLDGRPLFLHALKQVLTSKSAPPIAMLEAARQRSPRFAETRLLLLDLYGRHGRPQDAIGEAQSLMNLLPEQRLLVVRLIAGLAGRPGGPQALASALPASAVKGNVMLRLAQTGADSALLQRLAGGMRGLARDPDERGWIASLVTGIARRPDPAGARALWAIFHDADPAQVGTAVTDPEFAADSGDPPFGWSFTPGKAGIATVRDGALDVYYYGRANAVFASQMLMLQPGDYLLTAQATSTDAQAPRGLAWQVACLDGTKPLATAGLAGVIGDAGGAVPFTVPPTGCALQSLQLKGTVSDVPASQSARIERVAIDRAAR